MIYDKKTENLHAALETHHLSPPRARPPRRRRRLASASASASPRLATPMNKGKHFFVIFISKITFFMNKGKQNFVIFIPNIVFFDILGKRKLLPFFIFLHISDFFEFLCLGSAGRAEPFNPFWLAEALKNYILWTLDLLKH